MNFSRAVENEPGPTAPLAIAIANIVREFGVLGFDTEDMWEVKKRPLKVEHRAMGVRFQSAP